MTAGIGLAEPAVAQTWSPPFNHNQAHAGYGDYSHPYSPWNSTDYPVSYPTPAGTPIVDPHGLLSTTGWPQPAVAGGKNFNAVHMSLIPKGPYRGMVIVWNRDERVIAGWPLSNPVLTAFQPYAIVDTADVPAEDPPGSGIRVRYRNFLLPVGQASDEDLFCAGHAWSPYGDLIVVGGTDYILSSPSYHGGRLTFVWNPRRPIGSWPFQTGLGSQFYLPRQPGTLQGFDGLWVQGPSLVKERWYPTATLTHRMSRRTAEAGALQQDLERIVVLGGTKTSPAPLPQVLDEARNSYEALVVETESIAGSHGLRVDSVQSTPNIRTWIGPGVTTGSLDVDWLDEYPRCHLLSSGRIFFSGYAPRWATLDHDGFPGIWTRSTGQPGAPLDYSATWLDVRHDGSSVLFPNLGFTTNVVVRLGGAHGPYATDPTTSSMESIATASSGSWQAEPAMPATDGLHDGGRTNLNTVILPTGALLVLGGAYQDAAGKQSAYSPLLFENGDWKVLQPNPTPSRRNYHSTAVLLPDGRVLDLQFDAYVLQYGANYAINCNPLPLGHAVAKVVLMAPCSTTHHSDMHQRYVELRTVVQGGNQIVFSGPGSDREAPRGLYMLWLVTNAGFVSQAVWVMFQ